MTLLKEFIRNPLDQPELLQLIFSKNSLKDEGIKELATGLFERYMSTRKFNNRLLKNLEIKQTSMTDYGFKYLM